MYDLLSLIGPFLSKNPTIIEAGACSGIDTLALNQLWPNSQIYAFEPNPNSYRMLKKNVSSIPNISYFNIALGDKSGFTNFYVCRHPNIDKEMDTNDPSSILRPYQDKIPGVSFNEIIQVPITTLDDWAEKNNVTHIDFMWLDMQGSEGAMLKACPKIFQTVKAIQTEYSIEPLYEGTLLLNELHSFLIVHGFKQIFQFGGNHGDLIYIRS
jgi:FkbM family methyltransferase